MPDQEQHQSQAQPAAKGAQLNPGIKPYMTFNPPPILLPTGVEGLTFDFNLGARVQVPQGDYRVRLIDKAAEICLYDAAANGTIVTSTKRYFVQFRLEVLQKRDRGRQG